MDIRAPWEARAVLVRARMRLSSLSAAFALLIPLTASGCASTDGFFFGDPAQAVRHAHDRFGGGDAMTVDLGPLNGLSTNARETKIHAHRDEKSSEMWITVETEPLSNVGLLYAKCHSFDLLADGKPVPHGEPRYSMELVGMSPHEKVEVPILVADAKQLANVSSFEGRICKDEFSLWRVPLARLKAFFAELR